MAGNPTPSATDLDKRAQASRAALLDAFFQLVQQHSYGAIRIGALIARAGVARSTFYEHFANKDALLAISLEGPFTPLVTALGDTDNLARRVWMLEHFAQNRILARHILSGPARRHAVAALAGMIQRWLRSHAGGAAPRSLRLPAAMVARQLAELLLAPVSLWLDRPDGLGATALATGLRHAARGALAGLSAD